MSPDKRAPNFILQHIIISNNNVVDSWYKV